MSTTIVPTGRPGAGRVRLASVSPGRRAATRWQLELPARTHLAIDARGLPTGAAAPEPAGSGADRHRTFDDLYALGGRRRLALTGPDGSSVAVVGDAAYPFAQVWVPPGRPFAALEPMTAPTNALVGGTTPFVEPGDEFTARFRVELDAIRTAGSRARPR